MHIRHWLLALVVIASCSKETSKSAPAGSASGSPVGVGPASGAPPPAPDGSIEIFVDDTSVARVTKEQIASWPRLDSLVPENSRRLGTWQTIQVRGKGKPAELNKPSTTYPEMVGALFPGERGPSFGMFDPVELAKKGTAGVRHDDVREIRIVRAKGERGGDHQGGGAGEDPLKLKLTVKTAKGDKVLTGDQILALPREEMPGNPDTRGWTLSKLLGAAQVTTFKKLVLVDAAGTSLVIERADFDDKTTIPFIKLNRQGSLRFRMMKKQGEGWQPTGDLRALTTIKVD